MSGLVEVEELLKQMQFLKVCAVVTMSDNNELGYITKARRDAIEMDAIESFKKDFNYDKPESGVAILCVCDRLLTGFDAPVEQAMYLDKNLREHDLMQAIARVNRTKVMKCGYVKEHGIVVDYFGVASHLKTALAIYTTTDEKEFEDLSIYFRGLDKEIPVLESRFRRLLQLFQDYGVKQIELFVNQKMVDEQEEWELVENCVALGAAVKFRAQFDRDSSFMTVAFKIAVKHSKRKTTSIYLERDGSLSLFVTENTTEQTINDILKANEYKIHKFQAKRELLNEHATKREPVNGQSFLYLGRNYYLQFNAETKEIEFKGRYFYAPEGSSVMLDGLFKEFYRKCGYKFIPPRAKKYADMMGLTIEEISVQELKSRWASCSDK